jgi:hypothetical protein
MVGDKAEIVFFHLKDRRVIGVANPTSTLCYYLENVVPAGR